MSMEIHWMELYEVLAIHRKQLAFHGGADGVRSQDLLESALAKPLNITAYASEAPSLHRLAASYGFGIAKNHPFADGNKRTAAVASIAFLELNGFEVTATQQDVYLTFLGLAAGEISEDELTRWFEQHSESTK